jgi:hypothetical protein
MRFFEYDKEKSQSEDFILSGGTAAPLRRSAYIVVFVLEASRDSFVERSFQMTEPLDDSSQANTESS